MVLNFFLNIVQEPQKQSSVDMNRLMFWLVIVVEIKWTYLFVIIWAPVADQNTLTGLFETWQIENM